MKRLITVLLSVLFVGAVGAETASADTCRYQRKYSSGQAGSNQVCVYTCLYGDTAAITIKSHELCPLSIENPTSRPRKPITFVSPGAAAAEGVREFYRSNPPPQSYSTIVDYRARVWIEGSSKDVRNLLASLINSSAEMRPVGCCGKPENRPEINLSLQKDGSAKVKCGSAKTVLPGPTVIDLVNQLRE